MLDKIKVTSQDLLFIRKIMEHFNLGVLKFYSVTFDGTTWDMVFDCSEACEKRLYEQAAKWPMTEMYPTA